jgi:hypothetical protein
LPAHLAHKAKILEGRYSLRQSGAFSSYRSSFFALAEGEKRRTK